MLNLCCASTIQGRELCWHDFMEYSFNIVMCQDTCEPIHFKLNMVLNTTKLYGWIPVWVTLMFTQTFDVHSRSQGYGKPWTCAIIVLWSCMKQLNMDHLNICFLFMMVVIYKRIQTRLIQVTEKEKRIKKARTDLWKYSTQLNRSETFTLIWWGVYILPSAEVNRSVLALHVFLLLLLVSICQSTADCDREFCTVVSVVCWSGQLKMVA